MCLRKMCRVKSHQWASQKNEESVSVSVSVCVSVCPIRVKKLKSSNAGNRTRGSNVKGLNVTDYTTLDLRIREGGRP